MTSGCSTRRIPATEWIRVTSSDAGSSSGGRSPGSRRASIVLPGARRAAEQEVVAAGRGDLERAAGPLLAVDVGEIGPGAGATPFRGGIGSGSSSPRR